MAAKAAVHAARSCCSVLMATTGHALSSLSGACLLPITFSASGCRLLGASAANVILAARSMCYWNPLTGELRNQVETEMGELAYRAAVSVRTVKDVLNQELVKRFFLRYKVRRVMTTNGVRTAGISLEVRMDDPLTPADQQNNGLSENEDWYTLDIED